MNRLNKLETLVAHPKLQLGEEITLGVQLLGVQLHLVYSYFPSQYLLRLKYQ